MGTQEIYYYMLERFIIGLHSICYRLRGIREW